MPAVTFVEPGGAQRTISAPAGISLMEAARQNRVEGVVARCGGACACASCHVYVDGPWLSKLQPPDDMELGMLESAWQPRAGSRLSCQIELTPALDGLTVTVPERQCA
jgi:2Fe-2S ferredoxin